MLTIRRATPADAETLADLARRTFVDAFAAANRAEDIASYLEKTYSPERQRREIDDETIVTLIAEDDGAMIGFAQMRLGAEPPTGHEPAPVEVARFYVDRPWHGRAVARALMSAVVRTAISAGGRTLWLGVWEHNERAIAFYTKCGFRVAGTQPFVLGSDLQTDLVMLDRLWIPL
jgi:ribosomal protein S18 acetylase RimI-like enzyme